VDAERSHTLRIGQDGHKSGTLDGADQCAVSLFLIALQRVINVGLRNVENHAIYDVDHSVLGLDVGPDHACAVDGHHLTTGRGTGEKRNGKREARHKMMVTLARSHT
jgi:hypothetical protein